MRDSFNKAFDWYHRIQKILIVLIFMLAVIVTFFQVLNRTIFKLPISWVEELARYLLIWLTFMSAVVALRTGSLAMIDVLTVRFTGITKLVVEIFQSVVSIVFIGIVTVNVLELLKLQIETGQLTPALKISMSIPYFSIAVWGVLSILELVLLLVRKVSDSVKSKQSKTEL